jgi:hypothetical protein
MQRLDDLASSAERKGQSLIAQATEENAANIAATRQRAAALGEQAESATAPISPITPMQARAASRQAYELGESAMKKARADERKIWGVVEQQKDTPLPPVSFVSAYNNLRTSMLPEDTLPGIVDRVAKRFKLSLPEDVPGETSIEREARLFSAARQGEGTKPINAGELLELRSLLLDQSRNLRAQSNFKDANRVNTLADAVLDDLSQLGPSVAAAREFSKELNDRFSRGFMGDILGTKSSGAPRVRPELTLETATSAPPPRAAAQLGEMRTAVAEQGPAMQAVQQDFLRTLTTEIIDPATGSVLPKKVDGFLRRNAAILEQFPDLRNAIRQAGEAQRVAGEATAAVPQAEKAAAASLKEAEKVAEKALKDVLRQTGDAARQADKTAAFARVLAAGERPEQAVATAIRSSNPVRELTKLSTLALRGGPEAVGGLRAATLKYAMDDAIKGNDVAYGKLSQSLTDAVSNRGESVLQVLQRNKIMTADQRSQVEAFVKRGVERELADTTGLEVKEFGKVSGLTSQYVSRFFGARLGTKINDLIGGGGSGESLQAAQMGSELGKRMVSRLPADKVNQVMAQALKSDTPDELISILEYAAAYSPTGATRALDPFTREAITGLRSMLLSPGYESERPPGGAAAFRPEMLGRR